MAAAGRSSARRLADPADAPRAILHAARARPIDRDTVAARVDRALPRPPLRQARGVLRDADARDVRLARLLERDRASLPHEIGADAQVLGVHDHAVDPERLDHL